MHRKKFGLLMIAFGIALIIFINYNFLDGFVTKSFDNSEYGKVERVVDGDTVIINGSSCRLLGINTPERGEKYYSEAKSFTTNLALNKTFKIVYGKDKTDLYGRKLIYLFDGEENLNKRIVEEGFANAYFPSGKEKYYEEFQIAWNKCISENKFLCENSLDKCSNCVVLNEFNVKSQKVVFENICDFDCDISGWDIKDEGRKHFEFDNLILKSKESVEITTKDFNQTYVWTASGDTLFLRDNLGKLVLWKSY
jgi:endonuclease YncB( thermonuclease family)